MWPMLISALGSMMSQNQGANNGAGAGGVPYSGGIGGAPSNGSSGGGMFGNLESEIGSSNGMAGFNQLLSGLFGHTGAPFAAAASAYNKYAGAGEGALNPYNTMGQNAIGNYANWGKMMQNPSQFENNLMNQYQESPNAKFMQQQAMRSGENMGSAAGLMGSTPLAMQMQQNAGNISQQDMQNWLSNALGINQQYGNAEGNMMGTGAMSANMLSQMYQQQAQANGEAAYNQQAGKNYDQSNILGGIENMFHI